MSIDTANQLVYKLSDLFDHIELSEFNSQPRLKSAFYLNLGLNSLSTHDCSSHALYAIPSKLLFDRFKKLPVIFEVTPDNFYLKSYISDNRFNPYLWLQYQQVMGSRSLFTLNKEDVIRTLENLGHLTPVKTV